ncbi:O-antigen ligase family protein [Patescibacteria group bacterium]|nr:O-antigen ligase family protein [Patescibacteria group bacterium]MBU0777226.1 O-antigen ligase family protein [Patescibacteria group bacterium]MBU0922949.1 O-antigen ligase family protein [Patescibacteria group bacterium]MBU1066201.1 O-antigen ligase family protein [Patescibacteria group bacterium]MBU1844570.1 O-antigen ligase family protein [Patescibacteria group bacterium]
MLTSISLKRISSIFLLAIFVVLLPPIRFPFLGPDWLNTNMFARALILFVFLYVLAKTLVAGEKWFLKRNYLIDIILLFFIVQSLSVVGAINGLAFLKIYEKLIFGFMVFVIAIGLTKRNRSDFFERVIWVYFLAGVVKLFLEGLLLIAPDLLTSFADMFFKSDVTLSIKANLARSRTYIDLFPEASLPIFLYYFYRKKGTKIMKGVGIVLGVLLGLASFLSNWRGRVLVYAGILVSSFAVFKKYWFKKFKPLLLGGLILVLSLFILDRNMVVSKGFSVVDRLMNKDVYEDQMTIIWRIDVFNESVKMGFSSPFGVGLRNFYDWTYIKSKAKFLSTDFELLTKEAVVDGPHNIVAQFLAETGYIGLLIFLLMLATFASRDLKTIRSKQRLWLEKVTIILAFWGFILATAFYPATSLNFYISFFLFRAMLI